MKLRILAIAMLSIAFRSSAGEVRCEEVPDGETCNEFCDTNGNCSRQCYSKTKRVCHEVSPPPQSPQPAGGLTKGGGWVGVTIPIK